MIIMIIIFCAFSNLSAEEQESTERTLSRRYTGSASYTPPAAMLKDQIRLYGLTDLDIIYSNSKEPPLSKVTYGIWDGSRFGFKGSKELGSEVKALFLIEGGFGTKDGDLKLMQGGKLFGRQAYAGVTSGLGTVTLGKQYPASDAVAGIADIAASGSNLSYYKSQYYWNFDRLEDSVLYSSPPIDGFQARLGYAFGNESSGHSTKTIGLLYNSHRFSAGASLESWRTSVFGTSAANYNFWNLAASYDFGTLTLIAGFSSDDVTLDISKKEAIRSRTYAMGAKLPLSNAGKIVFLTQVVKPERVTSLIIISLSYTHTLSKRIALYAQIAAANDPAATVYGRKGELMFGMHVTYDVFLVGKSKE